MKIADCPFCGDNPEQVTHFPGRVFIECKVCFAVGSPLGNDREEAIELWNKRAKDPQVLVEALKDIVYQNTRPDGNISWHSSDGHKAKEALEQFKAQE